MLEPFPTVAIQMVENLCQMLAIFLKTRRFGNSYD